VICGQVQVCSNTAKERLRLTNHLTWVPWAWWMAVDCGWKLVGHVIVPSTTERNCYLCCIPLALGIWNPACISFLIPSAHLQRCAQSEEHHLWS
jgi:hypothetical protein